MFTYTRDRSSSDKHILCLMVDTEMVYLIERLALIIKGFEASPFAFMTGHDVPSVPDPTTRKMVQERFSALEEYIVSIQCYIKLRGNGQHQENIPSEGENGLIWLKSFQKTFKHVKKQFVRLQQEVIVWHLTLLQACAKDVRTHGRFHKRFGTLLSEAMAIVFQELMALTINSTDLPGMEEFWSSRVNERMVKYEKLGLMERLIPDAGSLSEGKLVSRVADLFFVNLQRWDRTHGLNIPITYSIMRYFAFEFETKFRLGLL